MSSRSCALVASPRSWRHTLRMLFSRLFPGLCEAIFTLLIAEASIHALASVVHASVWRIGLLRNLHLFGTTILRCCISHSLASTPRLQASCCHLTRPKTVYGLSSGFPFSTFWEAHDCIFDSRQANAQRMQMRVCLCPGLVLTLCGCIQVNVFWALVFPSQTCNHLEERPSHIALCTSADSIP